MDYCKTCVYYPPSSCDGKPCTQCDPESPFHNCYVNKEDYSTKERMDERLAMMHRLYPESEEKHTNADRIRSMTDEELAKFYFNFFFPKCPYCECNPKKPCPEHDDCEKCLLEWLKQESAE